MKEVKGELWNYYKKDGYRICLTVNGTLKKNGEAVLGRGCALEAKQRLPGIAQVWGTRLKDYGLKFMYLHEFDLFMFPVKYNWWEQASLSLIAESIVSLEQTSQTEEKIVLPRPGCGNGRLQWEDVRPLLLNLPDNVWVISKW